MKFLTWLARAPSVAAILLVAGVAMVTQSDFSRATMWTWSQTAGTNASADSTINWAEGMAPSAVNDSARAMMAAVAKYRDDMAGIVVTGGTSTAYTISSNQHFDTLAHLNSNRLCFVPHTTNGATVTLAVDGLAAKPLRSAPSTEIGAGVIVQGTPYCATYNNSDGAFYLNGFYANPFNVPLGAVLDYTGASAPNSNFVLPSGQCISRTTYAAYFSLISTLFGGCDGSTTFAVPDMRGIIVAGKDDMGGSARSFITSAGSGIDGTSLGYAGGAQNVTVAQGNLPNVTLPVTSIVVNDPGHAHVQAANTLYTASAGVTAGGTNIAGTLGAVATQTATTGITLSGNVPLGGSGTALNKMPPTMILNKILRIY